MDIERLEHIIEQYGIPSNDGDIVRVMRESHNVNVTDLVAPPARANTNRHRRAEVTALPMNSIAILEGYRARRASLNHSRAAQVYSGGGFSIIGRSSSPRGSIDSNWHLSQGLRSGFHGLMDEEGRYELPFPLVVDQNTRLDLVTPTIPDVHDHIRVQVLIPPTGTDNRSYDAMSIRYTNHTGAYRLPRTFTGNPQPILAEGWIPIVRDGYTIGFKLPEEIDPQGKHLIVFRQFRSHYEGMANANILGECLADLHDRWVGRAAEPTVEVANPITDEHRQLVTDLQWLRSMQAQSLSRITALEQAIQSDRATTIDLETRIANSLRSVEEKSHELQVLREGSTERIVSQARAMFQVADQVRAMRPISEASVETVGNEVNLTFITHKFGMRYRDSFIEIPRIKFLINMMADRYEGGIKIMQADQSNTTVLHPHLGSRPYEGSYTPCWGNAGRRPIPEAWANREWTNLVRIITSWVTQQTGGDHMTSMRTVSDLLPRAPRQGWLIPGDHEEAPVPVEIADTVDLVGEAVANEAIPF